MPFWGPVNARPAVATLWLGSRTAAPPWKKIAGGVVFFLLARMTMYSVIATNNAKMPMLAAGLPTAPAARTLTVMPHRLRARSGWLRRADRAHGWRTEHRWP